ncbi:hypothetical protein ILUMI_27167 [Ignelater luminosus]|uniref:Uncharacterized protein n=1 Tax=Ignelater luminosus TaxID=2038154 RepID=A0A8K0C4V1_IGNLU|nr:hypothetical protein ILUMI_27167 [Ignelater luminosus]
MSQSGATTPATPSQSMRPAGRGQEYDSDTSTDENKRKREASFEIFNSSKKTTHRKDGTGAVQGDQGGTGTHHRRDKKKRKAKVKIEERSKRKFEEVRSVQMEANTP